jgi:hypothetical protein
MGFFRESGRGAARDRGDVSKKNSPGQPLRARIVSASDVTFCRRKRKIVEAHIVNAFAQVYFRFNRPFHLPLHERVISLPFPQTGKKEEEMNETFLFIPDGRGSGNNFHRAEIFTNGMATKSALGTFIRCLKKEPYLLVKSADFTHLSQNPLHL